MYTTCVIWLAFVPLYFGTANHVPLRITCMSVTISLSASVTVACLFSPKVSAIILFGLMTDKNGKNYTILVMVCLLDRHVIPIPLTKAQFPKIVLYLFASIDLFFSGQGCHIQRRFSKYTFPPIIIALINR